MAKLTVDEFIENLKKSRLLTNEQFEVVCADIEPVRKNLQTQPFVRRLIKDGLLTRWQVEMLLAGRVALFLGNYKLLDLLGRGGMGTVFKAEHTVLGRIVAIKLMARRLLKDDNAVARFHQEIQSAAALDNQHVVRAFDAAKVGDSRFLVMEYVEGEDLGSIIDRRGKLPIGEACELARQTALGLQHAHNKGMIHRDIKPTNLILTWHDDGEPLVKIFDMGLARLTNMQFDDDGMTRAGQVMGTPDYMSPEQGWDSKAVDIRGDIYSLGCTLFQFLSGCLPFQGENPLQKLMSRCSNDAPPIREFAAEIPADLEAVLGKMLARDPAERYQTPTEVAEALESFAVKPTRESMKGTGAIVPTNVGTAKAEPNAQTKLPAVATEIGYEQFLNELSTEATPASIEWGKPGSDRSQPPSDKRRNENSPHDSGRPKHESARPDETESKSPRRMWIVGGSFAAVLVLVCLVAYVTRDKSDDPSEANPGGGQANGTQTADVGTLVTKIEEQSVDEENAIRFVARPQQLSQSVAYSLGVDAPVGASIDPDTGVFQWTPSEAQGPGTFRFKVLATIQSNDAPSKAVEVVIHVKERDEPPVLQQLANATIDELRELRLPLKVSDADEPANQLELQLIGNVPAGASIDSQTGEFVWTPTEAQGPGAYTIAVRVAATNTSVEDTSVLSDDITFRVEVNEVDQPPQLDVKDFKMEAGQYARVRLNVEDDDLPKNKIVLSLDPGAPANAKVNSVERTFFWQTAKDHKPGVYSFTIRVVASKSTVLEEFKVEIVKPKPKVVAAKPLPSQADQDAAEKQIREIFRRDFATARTVIERVNLARKLFARADETEENTTAFVLYKLARGYALRARDISTALDTVVASSRRFDIDRIALTQECLKAFRMRGSSRTDQISASEMGIVLAHEAVKQERFAEATDLLVVPEAIARADKDFDLVSEIQGVGKLLKTVRSEFSSAPDGSKTLSETGKLAKAEITEMLTSQLFVPLFVKMEHLSFVKHSTNALPDRGKSLWQVKDGNVKMVQPNRNVFAGFVDSTNSYTEFTLRAKIAVTNTTGMIFFGVPAGGKFKGMQLQLRPVNFGHLKRNDTLETVAAPSQRVVRNKRGWDDLELRVRQRQVIVRLNGVVIVNATVSGITNGFIGLDAFLGAGKPTSQFIMERVRVRAE